MNRQIVNEIMCKVLGHNWKMEEEEGSFTNMIIGKVLILKDTIFTCKRCKLHKSYIEYIDPDMQKTLTF